jgi:molybdenum cofactor cytidylyltransferase
MVPAVVLAAGESTRMGRSKALLPTGVGGETFVTRLIRTLTAAGADDIIVVAGRQPEEIVERLKQEAPLARVVANPRADAGQLSSLQVALAVVDRPGVTGMLVTLVDVPLVAPETVRRLLDAFRVSRAPVVRPASRGRHGHPVVFGRRVFDELRRADPRVGAKEIVRRHAADLVEVEVDDEGAFIDIDTPEDYRRVFDRGPALG